MAQLNAELQVVHKGLVQLYVNADLLRGPLRFNGEFHLVRWGMVRFIQEFHRHRCQMVELNAEFPMQGQTLTSFYFPLLWYQRLPYSIFHCTNVFRFHLLLYQRLPFPSSIVPTSFSIFHGTNVFRFHLPLYQRLLFPSSFVPTSSFFLRTNVFFFP